MKNPPNHLLNFVISVTSSVTASYLLSVFSPANKSLVPFVAIAAVLLSSAIFITLSYYRHKCFGIMGVEEGGYNTNLDLIKNSSKVDMIATTFDGMRKFIHTMKPALLENNARIRVLLLDPGSDSFRERLKTYPAQQIPESFCGDSRQAVANLQDLKQTLEKHRSKSEDHEKCTGTIEWRFYSNMPTKGAIISDKIVRYWPYFASFPQDRSITITCTRAGRLGQDLATDFNAVWETASSTPGSYPDIAIPPSTPTRDPVTSHIGENRS